MVGVKNAEILPMLGRSRGEFRIPGVFKSSGLRLTTKADAHDTELRIRIVVKRPSILLARGLHYTEKERRLLITRTDLRDKPTSRYNSATIRIISCGAKVFSPLQGAAPLYHVSSAAAPRASGDSPADTTSDSENRPGSVAAARAMKRQSR